MSFPPASYAEWRRRVERELGDLDFDRALVTRTRDGLEIQPLYGAENAAPPLAGDRPARVFAPDGTAGPWRIVQELSGPAPEQVRAAVATTAGRGVGGYWLRFDEEVRRGLDPGWAAIGLSAREIGCGGAAIHRLEDLRQALADVDLAAVAVILDAGSGTVGAAGLLLALAAERGVPVAALRGGLGLDPLSGLAARGSLPSSLAAARQRMARLAGWCAERAPGLRAVRVSARPYHDAGATAVEELAFALATGTDYLRWMCDGGLGLEAAAGQLFFEHCTGTEFFLEIAKLRAARLLWARVLEGAGGATGAGRLELHARTSWRDQSLLEPEVNHLRTTAGIFAAAVGGADSIAALPFDAAGGAASAEGERLAVNAQLVLREESHLARVADAAGGSWYLESLTRELAASAWQVFQEIEAAGGMAACLEGGRIQSRLEESAALRREAVARRKEVQVGVSEFADATAPVPQEPAVCWERGAQRAHELETAPRPEPPDEEALRAPLPWAARQAARGADAGSIAVALLSGERPIATVELEVARRAEPFERLRRRADGLRGRAFLVNLGPVAEHRLRAGFARTFLAAGGVEAVEKGGFEDPAAAARAFAASGCKVAVICSSDERYRHQAAATATELRRAGARRVLLAGRAGDLEETLRAAGVDGYLYLGADALEVLGELLESLEETS